MTRGSRNALGDAPTLGVEEEYLIVAPETGELLPLAPELLGTVERRGDVEAEAELMACAIEVATGVCRTSDEVHDELLDRRRTLASMARRHGAELVGLGTHPYSSRRDQQVTTVSARFSNMLQTYRLLAREQVICGFHVHVGIDDPDTIVATMARLRPWLAPVLALSANSPMWQGQDSGYQSYRTVVWQRWPTAQMPPVLADHAAYRTLVDQLVISGTISDASHLYWYARPSEQHPTLEVRIGDIAMTAGRTTALAALIRALVWQCSADPDAAKVGPEAPSEVLEGAIWRAARHGVGATLVSPTTLEERPAEEVVGETLAMAGPCLAAAGDLARVEALVEDILRDGTGADRQRALAASSSTPCAIVHEARRRFTDDAP